MSDPTTGPNADMARYWANEGGPTWVRDEAIYDTMLRPFNDAVIAALAPQSGERILDVGCGFGSTALAAAALGATVHGVDISPPMIERARERASSATLPITFDVADAQVDALPGPFHAVTSRFGVMFFADPVAAFANLAAATEPGGRVAFVCWQPIARNPWMSTGSDVVRGLLSEPPPPPSPGAGPFAFGDTAFVERVLGDAGWTSVHCESFETMADMGGDAGIEGAVRQSLTSSATKALLALGDESTRERAAALLRERFTADAVDGVVRYPAAAWVVTARR
jgi:SAM-dependent methyltransferase